MIDSNFIFDLVVGGLIIAISGFFIRHNNSVIGGFIYGAFPVGFIYLYLTTYKKFNLEECKKVSKAVLISSFFFSLYVFFVLSFNSLGPVRALLISSGLTAILIYVFFKLIGITI